MISEVDVTKVYMDLTMTGGPPSLSFDRIQHAD